MLILIKEKKIRWNKILWKLEMVSQEKFYEWKKWIFQNVNISGGFKIKQKSKQSTKIQTF